MKEFFCHNRPACFYQLRIFLCTVDIRKSIFDFFRKIMIIQGFLDIVIYTKADRPFGIFELVIGTYKNNFYERLDLQSFLTHGDPIQIRHLNIRDDQIYMGVFQDVQSGKTVIFYGDHSGIQSTPVNIFFDAFCGEAVVIYNHYILHHISPSDQIQW